MDTNYSEVTQSAMSLPQSDRAKLASALIRSLDSESEGKPAEIAEEWGEVILARSDALHRGEVQFIDGEEVVSELRAMVSPPKSAANE